MTVFLWVIIVLLVMSVAGKLYWLGSGEGLPLRKTCNEAWDIAINCVLVIWAVSLLM